MNREMDVNPVDLNTWKQPELVQLERVSSSETGANMFDNEKDMGGTYSPSGAAP